MFRQFYPDRIETSTYSIDFEELYEQGIRGIIFDIDNTLVKHGADADERALRLMRRLTGAGFQICFLSNNNKERVERFNKEIHGKYIFNAHKPAGQNYRKAMEKMGTDLVSTVFIGDQLFTDVFGAKRVGMRNILVRPIDPHEEIQIVLKRYLERIVLYFYGRNGGKQR